MLDEGGADDSFERAKRPKPARKLTKSLSNVSGSRKPQARLKQTSKRVRPQSAASAAAALPRNGRSEEAATEAAPGQARKKVRSVRAAAAKAEHTAALHAKAVEVARSAKHGKLDGGRRRKKRDERD